MTTATPRTTPAKKKKLFQFTFEFCSYLDLFSGPFGLKPAKTKYLPGINFKRKYGKEAIVASKVLGT